MIIINSRYPVWFRSSKAAALASGRNRCRNWLLPPGSVDISVANVPVWLPSILVQRFSSSPHLRPSTTTMFLSPFFGQLGTRFSFDPDYSFDNCFWVLLFCRKLV
ncbi:hypothetical protein E1A91_D01G121200v1 [Gossypium mustelinum]|uniref:Uncharacterized protein n=1 Tax=Gossypium mustelinum TaxID=34275 RepID=A0A5D2W6C6_GOSMU|nr:hypothetical protein E1A91_D01G121200v1 [Gossypium mustelinum]